MVYLTRETDWMDQKMIARYIYGLAAYEFGEQRTTLKK